MHQALYKILRDAPFVPTAFPTSVETLCGYARALHDEHYPAIELLARPLDELLRAFERIAAQPERKLIRWGIGTIKTASAAKQALGLRPDFLVSPAFSRRVLELCASADIPYIPGVQTFQDVQDVLDAFDELRLEIQVLKLCPVYGLTIDYVQALSSCFPGIAFCPTGEVTHENYLHWKNMPSVIAPMGSRLIPRELLESHDFTAVRKRLRDYRDLARH